MPDFWKMLEIEPTKDVAIIKRAYATLAKKYHPDMNPGDQEAEKKFKEASEAYAVLSDPEKSYGLCFQRKWRILCRK